MDLNAGDSRDFPSLHVWQAVEMAKRLDCLCAGITVPSLDNLQVAVLLSCAHLSGWSAEKLSNKIQQFFPQETRVMPETIYSAYHNWLYAQSQTNSEEDRQNTRDDMLNLLNHFSIELNFNRNMSDSSRPYTVPHALAWFPMEGEIGVFQAYDVAARQRIVGQISWARLDKCFLAPIGIEEIICASLGPEVRQLIQRMLRLWYCKMKEALTTVPWNKKLSENPESWRMVARVGKRFKLEWQDIFGEMDDEYKNLSLLPQSILRGGAVPIAVRSTGAASKIFCCQMLVARLIAFDSRRKRNNQEIAYIDVAPKGLPGDVTKCIICHDEFVSEAEQGNAETPIQVLACCGNYFGKECLRRWYRGATKARPRHCPLCNKGPSGQLLDKLLRWDDPSSLSYSEVTIPMEKRVVMDLEEGEVLDSF